MPTTVHAQRAGRATAQPDAPEGSFQYNDGAGGFAGDATVRFETAGSGGIRVSELGGGTGVSLFTTDGGFNVRRFDDGDLDFQIESEGAGTEASLTIVTQSGDASITTVVADSDFVTTNYGSDIIAHRFNTFTASVGWIYSGANVDNLFAIDGAEDAVAVGVALNSIDDSAIFEVLSTTRGFLPPRLTTAQRNAIATPAPGLQIFNTDAANMQHWNGTAWVNEAGANTPPGGNSQAVQFNNAGSFDGVDWFFWDIGNDLLVVGDPTETGFITIAHNGTDGTIENDTGIFRFESDDNYEFTGGVEIRIEESGGGTENLQLGHTGTVGTVVSSNGISLELNAATFGINSAYTLPGADGAPNQYLQTDGAGVVSFVTLDAVTVGAPDQTITSLKTFAPNATGALGADDIVIGDPTDYGVLKLGDATIARTSLVAGPLDLDGSMLTFNEALPATSNIEFAWADGTNSIRFALAVPGAGNATYSPRSMLIAGPAVLDDEIVTVGYWRTNAGIFDNIDCDTALNGADLGVQNDLEVEGIIYADVINESTPAAAVTLQADDGGGGGGTGGDGQMTWDGNQISLFPSDISFGEGYLFGWGATGDPTTPFANRWNLNSASGFNFIMSNAAFPQWIVGNTDPTSAWFIDGNGNKDIRINTLDTGFDQDNVVYFGYGGINLQDDAGDAVFIRSAQVVAGTYTITLPDNDGDTGQYLRNSDGAATLEWADKPIDYVMPVVAEENGPLAAASFEWGFGDGANTPSGQGVPLFVPAGLSAEVVALGLSFPSGTATVELEINGVLQGAAADVTHTGAGGTTNTLATPVAVANGDILNFRTTSVPVATTGPAQVVVYVRVFN